MTYIVTGATGHLGNTIVRKLLLQNEKVRCLALAGESLEPLQGLDCEIVLGDVTDPDSLEPLFFGLEQEDIIVIHSAGLISISMRRDEKVREVNVQGTKNILAACKRHEVKRLIYISSVHAIPEPENKDDLITEISYFDPDQVVGNYAKTKAEATQAVLDAGKDGLDIVVLHPSGITGPNDWQGGHFSHVVLDYVNKSLKALVKGGYDFVDVRDVADAVISAVEQGKKGECYILSNRYFEIQEIVDDLTEITGGKKISLTLPFWLANFFAPLVEGISRLLKKVPLYTRYSLYTLQVAANFSHAKASRDLSYKTRPMRETLYDAVAFFAQGRRFKNPVSLQARSKVQTVKSS